MALSDYERRVLDEIESDLRAGSNRSLTKRWARVVLVLVVATLGVATVIATAALGLIPDVVGASLGAALGALVGCAAVTAGSTRRLSRLSSPKSAKKQKRPPRRPLQA